MQCESKHNHLVTFFIFSNFVAGLISSIKNFYNGVNFFDYGLNSILERLPLVK